MRKLVVSERVTLDGVFDADSMAQWFDPYHSDDRAGYIQEGILASDAFLLGRATYEMLAPYWSSLKNNEFGIADRLNSAPKYVVSSRLKEAEWNNSTIIEDNVVEEVARLKQQPGQDMLIMGSATLVESLMAADGAADRAADVIDEYRFLVHPVVVGRGKRFFKEGMPTTGLKLVETKTLGLGVMLLRYQPAAWG
jgi:dihydrofolate reductase